MSRERPDNFPVEIYTKKKTFGSDATAAEHGHELAEELGHLFEISRNRQLHDDATLEQLQKELKKCQSLVKRLHAMNQDLTEDRQRLTERVNALQAENWRFRKTVNVVKYENERHMMARADGFLVFVPIATF